MDRGPTKVNPPNSYPSNPIHKAATAKSAKTLAAQHPAEQTEDGTQTDPKAVMAGHHINKIVVAVGLAGLAAWSLH